MRQRRLIDLDFNVYDFIDAGGDAAAVQRMMDLAGVQAFCSVQVAIEAMRINDDAKRAHLIETILGVARTRE